MRKLLLVMLVPFLVLGVMGCGKAVPDGAQNPIGLQGYWQPTPAENAVEVAISGNQATLINTFAVGPGNVALRTSYDGYKGAGDSGLFAGTDGSQTFKLEFFWFDTPYDKIGEITAKINDEETFEVTEVKYEKYYNNVMLPAKGVIYSKVTP